MSKPTTYSPQEGSVAANVVRFFQANPEESLYVSDIVAKWGASPASVHTLLRTAVEVGMLNRTRDGGNEFCYTPGPACATAAISGLLDAPQAAQAPKATKPATAASAPANPRMVASLSQSPERLVLEIHIHLHQIKA